ncbi:MAG TPA: dephospho-CoA kinase [Bacteroidales bacterium]|nr:dephospho-CoA kinase [Bacteroidales bacterium]
MLQIGLTGNIGSGKSTVANIFEHLGIPVYRADVFARNIMEHKEVIEEIGRILGERFIGKNNQIDRRALAAEVFSDKDKLASLNGIVHPRVLKNYDCWVDEQKKPAYVMMESAILYEAGLSGHFNKIIVVSAPFDLRIKRVMGRDNVSQTEALQRAANQMEQHELEAMADLIIVNDEIKPVIPQILEIDGNLRNIQQ